MNVQQLAELGYTCGLNTLAEALLCMELHWDAYPPGTLETLHAELERAAPTNLAALLDTPCVSVIGEARCREMDAELEAVLSSQAEQCGTFDERELCDERSEVPAPSAAPCNDRT